MKRILKILGVSMLSILVAAGLFYGYASSQVSTALAKVHTPPALSISQDVAKADIALGKRIVTVRNGCTHCHGEDLSGTLIAEDPALGKVHGANITPYGVKDWTDEQLAMAIRHGVRPDGRSLVFMPSYEFQNLSRSDLAATIAYLRSVPPVAKPKTPVEIGPLAKVLFTLDNMPVLVPAAKINHAAPFIAKPAETASSEFGGYLVNSACVGCHGNDLKGGPIPGAPPEWPPAPDLRLKGASGWSQQAFAKVMQTGTSNINGQALREPMSAMIGKYDDKEIAAVWLYLSSLQP